MTIAGIHPQSGGAWMEQQARNLTDPVDGCLRMARHLIHDRDPLYTRVFGEILESAGVQPIRLPPKSPNLNAYAERFVRSDQRGVSHTRGPARRGASASSRLRVQRTLPSREKPPGDSITSSCNDHHLREGRTPTFGGGYASEDYSVSTIERPHEGFDRLNAPYGEDHRCYRHWSAPPSSRSPNWRRASRRDESITDVKTDVSLWEQRASWL